jgi:type IV pilus assembly protein PilP
MPWSPHSCARAASPKQRHRLYGVVILLVLITTSATGCEVMGEYFDIVKGIAGTAKEKLEEARTTTDNWIDRRGQKTRAKVQRKEEEIVDTVDRSKFTYNPIGKRDPFRSFIEIMRDTATPKQLRQLEKTEKFELNQYTLVALVSGTSQPRAMVEDPEGYGHVLKIGTRLGTNGGRVTRISSTLVVVVEEYRSPTGERIRVPITIRLPQDEDVIQTENSYQ